MSHQGSHITERHMEALWRRLEAIYGVKFSDQFGTAIEVWFRTFQERGLGTDDIKRGIDACIDSGDQFPPSLPAFLRMCKPMRAAAHVPFEPAPRLSIEHRKQQTEKLGHHLVELKRLIGKAPEDGAKPESPEASQVDPHESRVA
jgi:hypothetical protein